MQKLSEQAAEQNGRLDFGTLGTREIYRRVGCERCIKEKEKTDLFFSFPPFFSFLQGEVGWVQEWVCV